MGPGKGGGVLSTAMKSFSVCLLGDQTMKKSNVSSHQISEVGRALAHYIHIHILEGGWNPNSRNQTAKIKTLHDYYLHEESSGVPARSRGHRESHLENPLELNYPVCFSPPNNSCPPPPPPLSSVLFQNDSLGSIDWVWVWVWFWFWLKMQLCQRGGRNVLQGETPIIGLCTLI